MCLINRTPHFLLPLLQARELRCRTAVESRKQEDFIAEYHKFLVASATSALKKQHKGEGSFSDMDGSYCSEPGAVFVQKQQPLGTPSSLQQSLGSLNLGDG